MPAHSLIDDNNSGPNKATAATGPAFFANKKVNFVRTKELIPNKHYTLAALLGLFYFQENESFPIDILENAATEFLNKNHELKALFFAGAIWGMFGNFKNSQIPTFLKIHQVTNEQEYSVPKVCAYFKKPEMTIWLRKSQLGAHILIHELLHALIELVNFQTNLDQDIAKVFIETIKKLSLQMTPLDFTEYDEVFHAEEFLVRFGVTKYLAPDKFEKLGLEKEILEKAFQSLGKLVKDGEIWLSEQIESYGLGLISAFSNKSLDAILAGDIVFTQDDCDLIEQVQRQKRPLIDIKLEESILKNTPLNTIYELFTKAGITPEAIDQAVLRSSWEEIITPETLKSSHKTPLAILIEKINTEVSLTLTNGAALHSYLGKLQLLFAINTLHIDGQTFHQILKYATNYTIRDIDFINKLMRKYPDLAQHLDINQFQPQQQRDLIEAALSQGLTTLAISFLNEKNKYQVGSDGKTLLMLGFFLKNEIFLESLWDNKFKLASLTTKDQYGKTAADYAEKYDMADFFTAKATFNMEDVWARESCHIV